MPELFSIQLCVPQTCLAKNSSLIATVIDLKDGQSAALGYASVAHLGARTVGFYSVAAKEFPTVFMAIHRIGEVNPIAAVGLDTNGATTADHNDNIAFVGPGRFSVSVVNNHLGCDIDVSLLAEIVVSER